MAHFSFSTNGGFDEDSLGKLASLVKRRSSSLLNTAEVEDVMLRIVADAAFTASKPGSTQSVATIAFSYAKRTAYYARARAQAEDLRRGLAAEANEDYAEKPSPEDIETRVAVRSVLKKMPQHLAQVLWLCDGEGYTLAEAALILGIPKPTVQSRRATARIQFKAAWAA